MPTSKYNRILLIFALSLAVLIVGLSVLLYNQGPRVRIVTLDRDPQQFSLTRDSTITISFDRPIEQADYADQISFTPAINFAAQASAQSIVITIKDDFLHDTDYVLEVGPSIYDQSGKPMDGSYRQTIATSSPRYAYLERNYSPESEASGPSAVDADDHIMLASLGGEPGVVFSEPEIKMFAANSEYLVVVANRESRDKLFTIDLNTREVLSERLLHGGRLSNLVIAPRGHIAMLTVTSDINLVSREYYDSFANRVESFSLETDEVRSITDENGDTIRAFSVQLASDGQVALIQDPDQTYYAVSPYNDYDPVLIGTHTSSFGFNDDVSEIIFRDNEDFVRYDIASGDISSLELDVNGFVQAIDDDESGAFIATTNRTASETRGMINLLRSWDDKNPTTVWSAGGFREPTLRDFSVSYDGSLLALQLNPDDCRYDQLIPNAQCTSARTLIHDVNTQETLQELDGFDLVWLP